MTTMELWEMQAQQAYASRDPWKRMDMVPDMGPVAGVVKKANLVDRAGPMVQKAGSGEPYKRMPQSRQGEVSPTSVTPFELQQLGLSKGADPYKMGSKGATSIPEWAIEAYNKYWGIPKKKGSK